PNVGKSTLYNALTRTRDAIVSDLPGVTRDRHYGLWEGEGGRFILVDTAGLSGDTDALAQHMSTQARLAIAEADLVLMLVDGRDGLLPDDIELAQELRRASKQMLLVVNKTDGLDPDVALAEFASLGVEPLPIAASHRRGVADLEEQILEALPAARVSDDPDAEDAEEQADPRTRVAVVGRPNVGKSTLVNRLLGEERLLAYDQPGTTRDAIEVPIVWQERDYLLVDTAGLRRRARVDEAVEKFSAIKAMQAIDRAHVVVFLIDAQQGFADQDAHILGQIIESGRGLVIALNKWDGLSTSDRSAVRRRLDHGLDFLSFAKRIPISAKHGSGLGELMKAVDTAAYHARREFSTRELTDAVTAAFEAYQPPLVRGRVAKLRFAHQGGRNPPRIIIHGNRLRTLPDAYKRYLENQLRQRFKVIGTPLRLEFREGKNPFADKVNPLTERQIQRKRRLMRHVKRR
ncbi:MAG: ribosome biogenesis GTPase Der, partial [Xanthomonadales bacterium]|nr:ribosome biogenesis GTPase Der [Xanthomonadales bacterium]